MKKWIPLLVICFLAFLNSTRASHLTGAEVTYKALSTPGLVEVHLIVYRNCDGGISLCGGGCGAACTQSMSVYGVDPPYTNTSFGSFTVSLVNVRDINDNYAAGVKSTCTNLGCATPGTFTPGIERYEFVGTLNIGPTASIPAACCNVRVELSQSSRYGAIGTGSANQNLYINAIINRCQFNSQPNSSPTYAYDPLAMMCGGQSVQYNMGASYDPDGDSLSYAFAPARQAYNSSVTYYPPWAYNTPMPWSGMPTAEFPGGIRCDPVTGRIEFTPGNAGSSNFWGVYCIEIKQWKTIAGVPIVVGITYRDMAGCVYANCQLNTPPALRTFPSNPLDSYAPLTNWIFPPGIQTCFTMVGTDTDYVLPLISDTTVIDTPTAMIALGGTFTRLAPVGSRREDSVRFCWTPTEAQQRTAPYILSIRVRDGRTPINGKAMYGLKIVVPATPSIVSVKDSALSCTAKRFTYTLKAGSAPVVKTHWSIRKLVGNTTVFVDSFLNTTALNYTFADTGLFQVKAFAFGDSASGYAVSSGADTVRLSTSSLRITGTDTTLCKNTSAVLSATVSGGKTPYQVKWTDNAVQYSGITRLVSVGSQPKVLLAKVTDSLNCSATDTVTVGVFGSPILSIRKIADTVQCENANVFKLFNHTNDSAFSGYSYRWLLDDSTVFTTDTIQFSLGTVGTHTLKLCALSPQGCRDTVQQKLVMYASPKALFTVNDSTQCFTVNSFVCTNQSTNKTGAMNYQWKAGTVTSTNTNFTTFYPTAGVQGLRLIAINSLYPACADTLTRQMYVYPQPTVSNTINKTTQCLKGNSFTFTNTSAQDTSISYRWVIDGDTSANTIVSKTFATTGTKSVMLKMISIYGCNDSLVKLVTVSPSPVALFTLSDSAKCAKGNQFTFTNQSTILPAGGLSYQWSMGNSATFTNQHVTYAYPAAGNYTVSLTTTSTVNAQCTDMFSRMVTVYPQPSLSQTVNNASQCIRNNQFVFTNTSTGLNNTNYSFTWNIDGVHQTGTTISQSFATPGSKSVKLFGYTNKGCSDSIATTINVNPQPVAQMTINDTDQCIKGNSFTFVNTSTGSTAGVFVIDGSNPNTSASVTRVFNSVGIKSARLIVSTAFNCIDTVFKTVEVLYSPTATFTVSDTTVCEQEPVVFTNTSSTGVPIKTQWKFSDQTIDSTLIAVKRFPASGVQHAMLKVVTDRLCADSIGKNIQVNARPGIPVISGPTSAIPDSTLRYSVPPTAAVTYVWQIDNGRFVSTPLDTPSVAVKWNTTAATGRLFVHTQNAANCASDTTRFDVSIIGGVGLNQVAASFQNLLVFPNPTTDAITVSLSSLSAQRIQITVYNIVGTQVKTATYDSPKGIFTEQINLHDLQKGMYLMHIEGETGSQVVKLMLR